MPFTYPYPRPSVTCDVVAFTMRHDDLAVLLIQRKDEPFRGRWALPGGFVNENESLERAASRELYEETGVNNVRLEQLGAFGDPGRDPRGHTVTVAWVTFLPAEPSLSAGDDAQTAAWHPLSSLVLDDASGKRSIPPPPPMRGEKTRRSRSAAPEPIRLAFDHAKLVRRAYRRICRHLDNPIRERAFDFVPPRFTLAELRRTYEVVLARKISPQTIKKHLVDRGFVVPATAKPAPKPAAQLYRWNRR